jgi:hypothetical protein
MKYLDCSSGEIEITSLREDVKGFFIVGSKNDLELLVKGAGWCDLPQFESEMECSAGYLIGQWFQLLAGSASKTKHLPARSLAHRSSTVRRRFFRARTESDETERLKLVVRMRKISLSHPDWHAKCLATGGCRMVLTWFSYWFSEVGRQV